MPPRAATMIDRYRRAFSRAPLRYWDEAAPAPVQRLALNTRVSPNWIDGARFWYRRETPDGYEFVLVDAATRARRPLFDHSRAAQLLRSATGADVDPHRLPIDWLNPISGTDHAVVCVVGGNTWRLDTAAGSCAPSPIALQPPARPADPDGDIPGVMWGAEVPAPNGAVVAAVRDHNLVLRSTDGERQLTTDGGPGHSYGALSGTIWSGEVSWPATGNPWPAQALWSPDSRRFLALRVDNEAVGQMHLLEATPGGRYDKRPVLHSYPLAVPGDQVIPLSTLFLVDAATGRLMEVDIPPVPSHQPVIQGGYAWWSVDSSALYVARLERGRRRIDLYRVDPDSGAARLLVSEENARFLDPTCYRDRIYAREAAGGREILWQSDRDGFRHVYRYDASTGELLGRVTSGEWNVDRMLAVDDEAGEVYLAVRGLDAAEDPYHRHVVAARSDGSGLRRLTSGPYDHEVSASPDGRFFVVGASRVDSPTVTAVIDRSGATVLELETADVTRLAATGWRPPERFAATGADGQTPVYGVMYRPEGFDPARRYRVVDVVYGGPQLIIAPVTFADGLFGYFMAAATAEIGCIVVNIDGRGTPGRARAFYDDGEGFTDGAGLIDHIAALEELAASRPYIDLSRVGITGFSGGGYTSTRALLKYPDFYHVAVSGAGSHNQWVLGARWGEQYLGLPAAAPEKWAIQSNTALAANLRGKLLLVHGEMDDDVPPADSLQLADALIAAGKRFDYLPVPRLNHSRLAADPYYWRACWDYFVQHLLEEDTPDWNMIPFPGGVWGAPATG